MAFDPFRDADAVAVAGKPFDPFSEGGAILLDQEESFDPFKHGGAIPISGDASESEGDQALAATMQARDAMFGPASLIGGMQTLAPMFEEQKKAQQREEFFSAPSATPSDPISGEFIQKANPNALSPSLVQSEEIPFSATSPEQFFEAYRHPLVSLPKPDITKQAGTLERLAYQVGSGGIIPASNVDESKALISGLGQTAEGTITGENVAALAALTDLPKLVQQMTSLGFGASMIRSAADELLNAPEDETPQEAMQRRGRVLGSLLMAGGTIKHGLGERLRLPTNILGPTAIPGNPEYNKVRAEIEQRGVSPASLDGVILSKDRLAAGFFDQTPEVQAQRRAAIEEIDRSLATVAPEEVAAAEERVKLRGQSTPPVEAPAPAVTTEGPPAQPTLFQKLQQEEARSRGEAQPTPAEEAPATPVDISSPEFIKAEQTLRRYQGIAEAAAEQAGATDAGTAVSEAILGTSDAQGNINVQGSLAARMARGEITPAQARAALVDAAKKAATNQLDAANALKRGGGKVESINRPEGEATVEETVAAPTPKQIFDSDAQSVVDRAPLTPAERTIVDAIKTGKYKSVAEAAKDLGITTQAASQSFNSALGKLESMGPGAASAFEPLARYEERQFGVRFGESKDIDPSIREATGNKYYEPIPNRVTAQEAADIINQRGTVDAEAIIRDEKSDLTPAVRSTIGQQLIKRLNQEYQKVKNSDPEAANAILNRTADLAEWQMEYGTRLGQGVQSFAMWSRLTPEGQLRIFQKAIDRAKRDAKKTGSDTSKIPELTDEIKAEITRLTQEIEAAPEGMPKDSATMALAKYMADKIGYSPWDLPLGIYYANILSGYNTHIVNAVDTALNVVSEIGTMAIDHPTAIPALLHGAIRGLSEGKSDAILALSEGRRVTEGSKMEQPSFMEAAQFGKKGGVPISETTRLGRVTKKIAESKIAYPLNAYKYVGRLMAASDTVFYRAAEEARAAMLVFKELQAQGKPRAEIKVEMDKMLGYDRIADFKKQAIAEGYKGAKADARATELMMQSRPEKLREEAGDFAGAATYNHAPEGLLGFFSNKVSEMTSRLPVLKLIVPFTRIVANVTNRGLDWTPYGYKRALAGRTFGDGPMIGEKRRAELTKATAGTMGLVGLGIMNQLGLLQVHGGGPSDPQRRRQLQAAGWKPYSIQVGDTYVSYQPTPLGLGLSSLGNYLDADRYQELKQKDALTRAAYSISRIPSTVFNQSFLSSLAGTFKALSSSSPGEQISELKKLFSRTSSSLVTPAIARDMNRIFDPAYRDSDSFMEDVIKDIPVARLNLRPSLNAYGDEAEQPSNRFVSSRKSDPAWRIVVEKNLRIPVADETVFTEPEAGYEYQRIAGEGMRRYVEKNLNLLKGMTADEAQESITSASNSIFENARAKIRTRYPGSLRKRR